MKSTKGDTHLGGDDVDLLILDWLVAYYKKDQGVDLLSSKDKMAVQRLREAAEKAKIELSSAQETSIDIPFITADESGPKHLHTKLTRSELNQLIDSVLDKTVQICKDTLKEINMSPSDIDEVLLVGGSTRIVAVQEKIKDLFGKESNRSINPDEVVTMGAAVQAGILSQEISDVLLLDVTSLSLGIETLGGVMTKLIDKNTTIPIKKSQTFSTAEDNQSNVVIKVLQGEREMASDNHVLGQFELVGIPLAPRGVPQIEVTFDIDVDGIIHVTAKDLKSKKEQSIKIDKPGMSKDEVDRLIKEAELHAKEDQQKKKRVESANKLSNLVYQCKKLMEDNKDKIPKDKKESIQKVMEKASQMVKDDKTDVSDLEKVHTELDGLYKSLGENIYASYKQGDQQKGKKDSAKKEAEPKGKTDSSNQSNKKDYMDTDFKDVNDKK